MLILQSETIKKVKIISLLLVYPWTDQYSCSSLLPGHAAKLHIPVSSAVRWGHMTSSGQRDLRELMKPVDAGDVEMETVHSLRTPEQANHLLLHRPVGC